jgi:putative redox protein
VTTIRHLAHAIGSTDSTESPYRVNIRTGKHNIVADEPAVLGGGDVGPAPLDLLVSALAACTANTLRMYAARKGWELASINVDIRYNVDDDKRTTIDRVITVPADLSPEHRERLVDIAERTPVTLAIRTATPITTTFRPGAPAE